MGNAKTERNKRNLQHKRDRLAGIPIIPIPPTPPTGTFRTRRRVATKQRAKERAKELAIFQEIENYKLLKQWANGNITVTK